MLNDAQLWEHVLRTESLLDKLESLEDEQARLIAVQAAQALMTLYGQALARIVSYAAAQNGEGATLLEAMTNDELVAHLLLLHELHPVPPEERVRQALGEMEPFLASRRVEAELVAVQEGVAYVRLTGSGCNGGVASAVQAQVQQALLQAAPELLRVQLAAEPASAGGSSFIPLGALTAAPGDERNG